MRQSIRAAVKGGAENDRRRLRRLARARARRAGARGARPADAARAAEGQGRRHLGAVDLRPAGARVRLRRRRRLARLVRPALRRGRRSGRALARRAPPRCCAGRGSTRAPRRSSTPSGWRARWPASATGRSPACDELLDATRAVLCLGSDVPLALVRAELVVGHRLGEVPEDTPMVPLQQDVARLQRRLRLKAEALVKEVTLDLRREIDRERSRLLHRLNLLDVPWGSLTFSARAGDLQGGVPARVVPGAGARADPRRPLGDDGRGRRARRA